MPRQRTEHRKVGVQISMDVALLARLDQEADRLGTSRSGLLRQYAEARLAGKSERTPKPRVESVEVAGRQFTVDVGRDRHWWTGSVRELPGCWSQGRTFRELREMIADAIEGYLIVRGDMPDNAPAAAAL